MVIQNTDKQVMMDDFGGWSTHVKNILSQMQKPNIWAIFNHPPAPFYNRGRVCLLGDAAHASSPHCGAGAGMAIEDAYVLSGLVGEEGIEGNFEAVFKAFDAVRRERTQKLVRHSKEQAEIYEFEKVDVGNPDDKEQIQKLLLDRMDWIWNEDLPAEMKLGKELLQRHKRDSVQS
jgi:salicylate hydroxylase